MAIDWDKLHLEAIKAMQNAYCPYSKFPVGAAGLSDQERIISGCNIENASYGLTLCAECSMVSNFILQGGGKIIATICINKNHDLLSPCGRCRQVLYEHGGKDMLLKTSQGILTLGELLPQAFGPEDLF
jgi:cytidine deaminase